MDDGDRAEAETAYLKKSAYGQETEEPTSPKGLGRLVQLLPKIAYIRALQGALD